ncbi:MAG: hypothetical protein R2881_09300 [Eubacteriales bacterium]
MYPCLSASQRTKIVNLATENGTISNHQGAAQQQEAEANANDPLYLQSRLHFALLALFVWAYCNAEI